MDFKRQPAVKYLPGVLEVKKKGPLAERGADCLCVMMEESTFNARVIVRKIMCITRMYSCHVICDRTH